MILSGYDDDTMHQPSWTQDGSFLVIRDLEQLVPEFEKLNCLSFFPFLFRGIDIDGAFY